MSSSWAYNLCYGKYTDLINHISKEKCGDTQNIIGPNVHVNSEEESNTLVVCYILKNIAQKMYQYY
jgi:hypothetical protein